MVPHSLDGAYSEGGSQVLWEDGERVLRCAWRPDNNGTRALLLAMPVRGPSQVFLWRTAGPDLIVGLAIAGINANAARDVWSGARPPLVHRVILFTKGARRAGCVGTASGI
jgi:hypothetical protein